jgi:hypothetical protein
MHFATHMNMWHVACLSTFRHTSKLLYNETALSQKPSGIRYMYIYTFLLRMTDIICMYIHIYTQDVPGGKVSTEQRQSTNLNKHLGFTDSMFNNEDTEWHKVLKIVQINFINTQLQMLCPSNIGISGM